MLLLFCFWVWGDEWCLDQWGTLYVSIIIQQELYIHNSSFSYTQKLSLTFVLQQTQHQIILAQFSLQINNGFDSSCWKRVKEHLATHAWRTVRGTQLEWGQSGNNFLMRKSLIINQVNTIRVATESAVCLTMEEGTLLGSWLRTDMINDIVGWIGPLKIHVHLEPHDEVLFGSRIFEDVIS